MQSRPGVKYRTPHSLPPRNLKTLLVSLVWTLNSDRVDANIPLVYP